MKNERKLWKFQIYSKKWFLVVFRATDKCLDNVLQTFVAHKLYSRDTPFKGFDETKFGEPYWFIYGEEFSFPGADLGFSRGGVGLSKKLKFLSTSFLGRPNWFSEHSLPKH